MEPVVESPAVLNQCERDISVAIKSIRSGAPVEKLCKNSTPAESVFLPVQHQWQPSLTKWNGVTARLLFRRN